MDDQRCWWARDRVCCAFSVDRPEATLAFRARFRPMTRLTASFWVSAYRKRLDLHGIPCFVTRHGDDTSGAVLVKLNTLDGQARVFQRSFDLMTGDRAWITLTEGEERSCDATCARQAGFDPDLWVLEVEDRQGRHLLDEDGLA